MPLGPVWLWSGILSCPFSSLGCISCSFASQYGHFGGFDGFSLWLVVSGHVRILWQTVSRIHANLVICSLLFHV